MFGLLIGVLAVTNAAAAASSLPLYRLVAESVDRRIAGCDPAVSMARFVNYRQGAGKDIFVANTNFWGREIDFSCASPWNSGGGSLRAGTLISKRHVVFAKHFPLWKDVRIVFVGQDGGVCPCRIAKTKAIPNTDIMVGSLDAEVTPNIHPAKILPEDYRDHVGHCSGLPLVIFNQHERALLAELISIKTNANVRTILFHTPFKRERIPFSEKIAVGDSGNPVFLIAGDEPILLFCLLGYSCGPGLHYYRREIQAAMDELCPGYKLESFDFAGLERK